MFKLLFSPQYSTEGLLISKSGDKLTINGVELDFSDMPDGSEYPNEAINHPMVEGSAIKENGEITLTVRLPYSNINPPHGVTFPLPMLVSTDGVVQLPVGRFEDGN